MPKGELRRHTRLPASHKLVVSWVDGQGLHKVVRALCVDISESGMRVESTVPIEAGSAITFRDDQLVLSGSGSVRYCFRREMKYQVGVEFNIRLGLQLQVYLCLRQAGPA
jgi:hypothetical protein